MKPTQPDHFEVFWDYVRKAEIDILRYGHEGCPPPDPIGDSWDEGFAAAYQAIKRSLRVPVKVRIFIPPPGMTWRPTPLRTKTALEALMWFLNPTKEVYGHPDLLKSPEYQAIKASAMEECQLSHKIRQKSVEQSADAKLRKGMKTALLRTFLFSDLRSRGKVGPVKPLTEEAISLAMTEKLGEGWSQSSVSREFEKLYPGLGIARYVEICGFGKTERNGILNKSADGTTDVDAFSYDEDPIDD